MDPEHISARAPLPAIHLWDTLSREKRKFEPQDPKRVTLYVCGPTVYNFAHIGNARPVVIFDTLFRLLRAYFGPGHVVYARNLTDIDDRIIAKAQESGQTIEAVSTFYATQYQRDMERLGALAPTIEPRATACISPMLAQIARLVEGGHAYVNASGVWFRVRSDGEYGRLSGRNLDEVLTGTRIEAEDGKEDPADFALWKFAKPGEPSWPTPWGAGRPGWHIECSAMIEQNLGRTIDIHGGGLDLVFPHHENEIAQSRCANHAPLARFWLHNGFLTMNLQKMSKSLGNVALVDDLLKQWQGEVLRFALLSAHYRAPLDFSDALLGQSRATLGRLYEALRRADQYVTARDNEPVTRTLVDTGLLQPFLAALADDLHTPGALAELSGLAHEIFVAIDVDKTRPARVVELANALRQAGSFLGLLQDEPEKWFHAARPGDTARLEEINRYVSERQAARAARNWAEADRLRAILLEMGVELKDEIRDEQVISFWRWKD